MNPNDTSPQAPAGPPPPVPGQGVDAAAVWASMSTAAKDATSISDHLAFERGRRVRAAAKWIGILTILLSVATFASFISTKIGADKALEQLSRVPDDEVLEPIDGKTYTVPELRAEVGREPYTVLGVNLLLTLIMGGLWVWARRSPLPAITCAIAVFVIVQVGGAIVEPKSLFGGIIIKLFALAALGKGLMAALAARAATKPRA